MHATAAPTLALPSRKVMLGIGLFLTFIAGLMAVAPSHALDLVAFTGIAGPLTAALAQLAALAPGVKALVAHRFRDDAFLAVAPPLVPADPAARAVLAAAFDALPTRQR